MSKLEPEFGIDTRTPDSASERLAADPWQEELGRGDFATGTSPGEMLEDDSDELPGLKRTRVTYLGDGTCINEESFYRPEPDAICDEGRTSRLPSLADRTPLWRIMSPRVVCVRGDLGTDSLIAMLFALDLRSVPVVDEGGRPVGVVSRSDLLRHWRDGVAAELVVDVMMCLSFSLPETASLSRAAAIMAYEGVHRIPVVAWDGTVVGLISSLDVARWLAQHDGYLVPGNAPANG